VIYSKTTLERFWLQTLDENEVLSDVLCCLVFLRTLRKLFTFLTTPVGQTVKSRN